MSRIWSNESQARAVGELIHRDLLPVLKGFSGQTLPVPFPWMVRCDIGTHTGGGEMDKEMAANKFQSDLQRGATQEHQPLPPPLLGDSGSGSESAGRGNYSYFLNEIEILPTLYIHQKFGHSQEFLSFYGQALVKTAAAVVGVPMPKFQALPSDYSAKASSNTGDNSEKTRLDTLLESELSAETLAILNAHLAS